MGSVKYHVPIEVAGPTGATAATRYAGATTSGAPASGSFLKGDFVIDQAGKVWVCTTAGSPGTWADVGGGAGVSFATPAIVLGSSAAAGSAGTVIRSDGTIAAFDATNPTTQAFGDSAAVGSAAFAARRDHKHAMPATPVTGFSKNGSTVLTGAVTLSAGTGISLTQTSQDIAIAATGSVGSELDYVTQTSDLTVTATTAATAQAHLTGNAVAYNGTTRVKLEYWIPSVTGSGVAIAELYDGSTDQSLRVGQVGTTGVGMIMYGVYFFTPSNATHTYSIKFWRATANMTVSGNGGGIYTPAWLRVTVA